MSITLHQGYRWKRSAPSAHTLLQSFPSNEINLRNCKALSTSCCMCGYLSLSLPEVSQESPQAADPLSFLSASPIPGTLVLLPPTSPLITEFISLEKRMAELIPVQGSDPAALCNLCSCSSGSAHLPCTFCVLGAEGGG